ncbi:PAS domain S-box-containing protein [Desulfobaculum xiamenense]|uniref:histidine kinase n=1 Tax=Desulfobaculum xiamenense TaxID=995050 RepID=A0A846QQ06_9BACT|nr:ABC transporter substrate-binding protein [Desulfobaculum xiamenense]NJB68413.1 PAS domain S-box-containing protein [Desulfobaculum xiamenense]
MRHGCQRFGWTGNPRFDASACWRIAFARCAVLLCACVVVALAACPALAREKVRLQLKWHHQFQFAGYYAAVEKGFYADEGFDVELVEGGPDIDPVAEVVAGRAEYGVGTAQIVLDFIHGAQIVLLAAIQQHSPFVIMVRSDSGISRPRELVGRRFMYRHSMSKALLLMLLHDGVEEGQVLLDRGDDRVEALVEGRVDAVAAYMSNEPFLVRERGVPVVLIQPRSYGVDFYGDCLFASRAETRAHADRARRFRRATLRGWNYALDNVEEMIGVVHDHYDGSRSRAHLRYEAECLRGLILPALVEMGDLCPQRLRHIADAFAEAGLAPQGCSLDGLVIREGLHSPLRDLNRVLLVAFSVAVVGLAAALGMYVFSVRLKRGIAERTQELEETNELLLGEIGDRAAAEEALRRSEAKFRALFDQTYQFCALLSPEGTVQMVNRTALEFIGVEARDIEGHPFWDTPWWNQSPLAQERVREGLLLAARGSVVCDEAEHVTAQGEARVIDFSIKPVSDADGHVVYILAEGRDITDRKRAAEETRRLRAVLQNVMDSLPSVLVSVDRQGRLALWNRNAAEVAGLTEGHLGMPLEQAFALMAERMDRVHAVAAGGEAFVEVAVATNGGERHVDVAVYPLGADKGAVVRIEDVTDRVRIQQRMIQTEKMMSVGGLAAGMAHEINNPLGIILQSGQNLRRRFSEDLPINREVAARHGVDLVGVAAYMQERGIVRYLDAIAEAGQRAARIVSSMLDFTRTPERGRGSFRMNELLDSALALAAGDSGLRTKCGFDAIAIQRQYDPDLPEVPCSRGQIEQVFLNVIRNAAEALSRGKKGDEPVITVSTAARSGFVRVTVADNGPGMDAQTVRRVFEPFFTTKPPGEGTGLGLSVAYFIVTATHGGRFRVESEPGRGTAFIVELPREG